MSVSTVLAICRQAEAVFDHSRHFEQLMSEALDAEEGYVGVGGGGSAGALSGLRGGGSSGSLSDAGGGGGGGGGVPPQWRPSEALGAGSFAEERMRRRAQIEVDASDIWGRSPSPEPADEVDQEKGEGEEPAAAAPPSGAGEASKEKPHEGASSAAAALDDEDVAEALANESLSDEEEHAGESEEEARKEKGSKKRKREKKEKRKKKKSKKKKKKKRRRSTSSDEESASEESVDDSLARQYGNTAAPEEPEPGPRPLPKFDAVSYGGALRPGEGDAIAAYVQAGKRIPRRYGLACCRL